MNNAKRAMYAKGRMKQGQMNQTEAAYAQHLEGLKRGGFLEWYAFEAMKFRLADNTFYTPDFMVMLCGGELEAHEVKGFWQDDARVKIKVAASLFPIHFIAVKRAPKRTGGMWTLEEF